MTFVLQDVNLWDNIIRIEKISLEFKETEKNNGEKKNAFTNNRKRFRLLTRIFKSPP